MKFYRYIPEGSGDYGPNTVYIGKKTAHPCVVSHLHYEFNYWPGDGIQWSLFHFIVTESLRKALEAVKPPLTGMQFDTVEISGDDQEFKHVWRKGRPDSALGKWYWLKITGKAGIDDFGLIPAAKLIVSERALGVIEGFVQKESSVREIIEYSGEIPVDRVPQKW